LTVITKVMPILGENKTLVVFVWTIHIVYFASKRIIQALH